MMVIMHIIIITSPTKENFRPPSTSTPAKKRKDFCKDISLFNSPAKKIKIEDVQAPFKQVHISRPSAYEFETNRDKSIQ